VHTHCFALLVDSRVRRGSNGNVVGVNRVVFQHLLHGNSYRRAAAPHRNQECGPKTAAHDQPGEFHRVMKQRVGRNKKLVHIRFSAVMGLPASILASRRPIQAAKA
jgi:hypothetical protein